MKVAVADFIAWDILGEEPMYPPSLQHQEPESGPQLGWYAISVNALRGMQIYRLKANDGTYFLRFQPVAQAGYSIYIYKVDRDECNRVRQELGWPPLPTEESKP